MTDLSVIVPTRNEASNVEPLVTRLSAALASCEYEREVIFVDYSDDSTPEVVETVAAGNKDSILLLQRELGDREGDIAGAVKCGFLKASGLVVVVMDGDLQHPPEIVPSVASPVLSGRADLVAGTRYRSAGSRDGLANPLRRAVASACRGLAHPLVPKSRAFSEPLSGLFALERSVVEAVQLQPDGYKILLEVAARGRWCRAHNVDYRFHSCLSGKSKDGLREGWLFLRHSSRLSRVSQATPPVARRGPHRTRLRSQAR